VDVLEVVGLSKSYGDAVALDNASLTLREGEIHAIVGENGAGKSTLVKCLSGIVVPDSGTVSVKGQALKFGVPTASRVLGVSTSFQELSLLGNLTVAENLLISALPTTAGIVTKRGVQAKAREILAEWGVEDLAPDALVGKLPLSAKQRLEIVRAMYVRPTILILDEPTAALPDTNWLFTNVRRLVAEGTTVVYISHKLREIQELCHRGTIMRNGAVVGSFDDPNFDHNELISTMIGRSINLAFPPRIAPLATDAPVVLKARSISVGSRVRNVDLDIRNGEIVGVAALEGQGQRELFYGLAGAISLTEGNAEISGTPINLQSPQTAMQSGKGIVLVPEERKREGLFTDQSTARNITSVALKKISALGVIRRPAEAKLAAQYGATANLPTKYLNREVGQLSGGNQQKSILARISLTGAQVLLMFDPTRGIDPSAKLEVYGTLRKAADEGAAILFYSTEIPELVGLSDRVIVLYAGRVAGEFSGDQLKESSLMAAAVGHSGAGRANAEESA